MNLSKGKKNWPHPPHAIRELFLDESGGWRCWRSLLNMTESMAEALTSSKSHAFRCASCGTKGTCGSIIILTGVTSCGVRHSFLEMRMETY
ncbi:hypothetical protein NPIL_691221 [Nephila pilipes]|uniref:Uncharacterized protein n=1 Tax=Nephila pilipes TaxID=299642 RepID=A0A8X6P6M5_NEPPI|nr:hypothetical protein NPIL_691221 [Nephila pilipes]